MALERARSAYADRSVPFGAGWVFCDWGFVCAREGFAAAPQHANTARESDVSSASAGLLLQASWHRCIPRGAPPAHAGAIA